ncbi:hypothetical protein M9Y10_033230 [Tritrichomonas musculus]|uniref:Uncharacterized protein n=1 Tax=Tritrichomonas musculus TaxID=1915356 RepID=A0ABR2GXB6_9EUKA
MVRYLVMQSGAVYTNILFDDDTPLVKETFDMILEAVEKLNAMDQEEKKEEDDYDINSYNEDKFYSMIFNHPLFYKNWIHQLALIDSHSPFYSLLNSISIKNNCLHLVLDSMSQELADIFQKRTNERYTLLNNAIHSFIHISNELRNLNNFSDLFYQHFGLFLLDAILTPEIRQDENMLIEAATLFSQINKIIPICITHLIGFLLLQNNSQSIQLAFKLLSKLKYKHFENSVSANEANGEGEFVFTNNYIKSNNGQFIHCDKMLIKPIISNNTFEDIIIKDTSF